MIVRIGRTELYPVFVNVSERDFEHRLDQTIEMTETEYLEWEKIESQWDSFQQLIAERLKANGGNWC